MKKLDLQVTTKNGFPISGVFFEIDGYKKAVSDSCGRVSIPYNSFSEKVVINWPRQHFQFTTIAGLAKLKENTLIAGKKISDQQVIEEVQPQETDELEESDKIEVEVFGETNSVKGKEVKEKAAGFMWPILALLGLGILLPRKKKN